MQEALFTLLTNEEARTLSAIEANFDRDTIAGAPWYDKAVD